MLQGDPKVTKQIGSAQQLHLETETCYSQFRQEMEKTNCSFLFLGKDYNRSE
jgi:hypothetical protein